MSITWDEGAYVRALYAQARSHLGIRKGRADPQCQLCAGTGIRWHRDYEGEPETPTEEYPMPCECVI